MDSPVHILIVDDTASLRQLYAAVLTRAGYAVLEAATGKDARELILTRHPDIVLLDRVLPDEDGSELCAWIKATPQCESTYVILISGLKTSDDERLSGLEAGADDYIVKPVEKRELLARVKVAVRLRTALRALAESETQFRTLTENAPDGILRLDTQGRPIYVNPGLERILGVSPNLLFQSSREELGIPNELAERWYTECQAVVADRRLRRAEFALPSPEGTRYYDVQFVPEFSESGAVTSILAVLRDFTERRRSEQAIARLAGVVEQAVEAVIITDEQGTIEFVNAAFERMTGHAAHNLIHQHLTDVAVDSEGFYRQLLNTIAQGTPWQGVSYLYHTDGRRCEIEATVFPIHDVRSGVANYAALLRDLTERRRSEQEREVILTVASALRRAVTRDEMVPVMLDQVLVLLGASAAAFTTVDAYSGEVVVELARGDFAHATGRRMLPAQPASKQLLPLGRPILIQGKEAISQLEWPGDRHELNTLVGVPLTAYNRELGVLWVGSSGDITSQTQGLLTAIADITANALHRVALYDELERYAAELEVRVADRTRELQGANDQLMTLDRLKSKFVSNVSHELRTPISNLKLYMELLHRGKAERRAHYEHMLETSIDRLGQLVEDILNLSRLEIAQYQPREMAPTDLNALINQIVTLHQPKADADGLTLTFTPDKDLPLVEGDYNQLSQLFTNLLVNSLNYTRQGSVQIRTQHLPEQNQVQITIEDTGVGILPEDLPHLFERFYRGNHRQAEDIPGTGLGLAIVSEIVDIHHGTIQVSSEVDVGTRFDIILPITQGEWADLLDAAARI